MNDDDLLGLLHETATAVRTALDGLEEWKPVGGERDDEYTHDQVADAAALATLAKAPVGILSEETGLHHPEREITIVVDPVDGSTNASAGLPWWATSLCAVDADGPRVALVVNQALGHRYAAVRGGGVTKDGVAIRPSTETEPSAAFFVTCGFPPAGFPMRQARQYGACALDMCAVADGTFDAFIACTDVPSLGAWDYLGGLLICQEAGAFVADLDGEDLVVLDHQARRSPWAAATPELLEKCIKSLNNQLTDL
jgi:fructose-1,6-bisphosphatase/inositol monophosphatase family enzyme